VALSDLSRCPGILDVAAADIDDGDILRAALARANANRSPASMAFSASRHFLCTTNPYFSPFFIEKRGNWTSRWNSMSACSRFASVALVMRQAETLSAEWA
jgi:hypothetical protein